jgi:hypothetical protein
LSDINIFDGLEDLIESEGLDLEDKCDEITPYNLHFNREAFLDEEWEQVMKEE